MPSLNGGTTNINILKQPRLSTGTGTNWGYSYVASKTVVSANSPMIYQLRWGQTISRITNLMPNADYLSGDLVNVIYDIYIGRDYDNSFGSGTNNMAFVGSLRKSRDLPYIANTGVNPEWNQGNLDVDYHTFTVDISPIIKNYLSYTLTPIKKGAPSAKFQMSGDYTTNDFLDYTSVQGTHIYVDVVARFEVYENDYAASKRLVVATDGGEQKKHFNTITAINSVEQEGDRPNINEYMITCGSSTTSKHFLSRKPNDNFGGKSVDYHSQIRITDEAEFLSWFQYRFANDGSPTYTYDMTDYYIRIETSDGDYCNVRDFQETLGSTSIGSAFWTGWGGTAYVNNVLSQNVAPAYLNTLTTWNLGQKINSNTDWYSARLVCSGTTIGSGITVSEGRYYTIDKESPNLAYDSVRFHWLNRMGGIDSYRAKRNITENISVNKVFFERKNPNSLYLQQYTGSEAYSTSSDSSDPVGADTYKSSVNTFNIDATRNHTVYTEPLNSVESKWLEELLTSPNVWIELDTEAGYWAEQRNQANHPSTLDYYPVTITNGQFTTVNQEEGLVKLNIEYTRAKSINTQSN